MLAPEVAVGAIGEPFCMNVVLVTLLAFTQGSIHNVAAILPTASNIAAYTAPAPGPAPYAYDQDHCMTRVSGAIVCPRRAR